MARRFYGFLAGATVLVSLAACHTMRPISPSQLVSSTVDRVWVTAADRRTIVLHGPRVIGDTLGGFIDGEYREMLLSDTREIKQRMPAPGRTAAVGVAVGVTTLAAFVYMANRAFVGDGQTCYAGGGQDGRVVPCCAGLSTISCSR